MAGRKAAAEKEPKVVKHRAPKAAEQEVEQPVEKPSQVVAKPVAKDPRGSIEERVGRLEAIVKRHGLGLGG